MGDNARLNQFSEFICMLYRHKQAHCKSLDQGKDRIKAFLLT